MDGFSSWAMQKAEEIVSRHMAVARHEGDEEKRHDPQIEQLRADIFEALIEAYGLGREPIGDD